MGKQLFNQVYTYLPFILLMLGLVIQVILFSVDSPLYKLDETIVITLSKKPFDDLFLTLQAEPHPPGFYIFLKLFTHSNPFFTRFSVTVLSFALSFLVVFFGYKIQIMQRLKLTPGLSIILSSYGFLELSSSIKQESFSLPLLLLFIFLCLKSINQSKNSQLTTFVIISSLSLLIFIFGYIYYAISLLGLVLYSLFLKNNKQLIIVWSIHFIAITTYLFLFGFEQLLNNLSRFAWLDNNYNSFFRSLSVSFTGNVFNGFMSDLVVLLLITCLFVLVHSFAKLHKSMKQSILITTGIFVILLMSFYVLNLFVRQRYVFPLFMLTCMLAGWGIHQLKHYKLITIVATTVLLLSNLVTIAKNSSLPSISEKLADVIKNEIIGDKIGLIDEHAMYPYIFRINNPELTTIIPINIFISSKSFNYSTLTREQILSEGQFIQLSDEGYAQLFKQTNLTHYLYKMQTQEQIAYFDPQRKIISTLVKHCQFSQIISLSYKDTLFEFEECQF